MPVNESSTKIIKRKRLSIKKILILLLMLYLFGCFIYYLIKLPIKTIQINGTSLISDVEIIEKAKIKEYPSILKVSSRKLEKMIKDISLVDNVEIKKDIFGKLVIKITENKVLFYNRNSNTLVLEDGRKIDFEEKYLGIPILINYIPNKILKIFIEKLKNIDYDIIHLISEIEYSPLKSNDIIIDDTRFLFRMNDGNMVYINTNNIEYFNSYVEMASTFEDKRILNLDSTTGNFIFSPIEETNNNDEGNDT